jgi:P27 family predicted phage terminase small subunit
MNRPGQGAKRRPIQQHINEGTLRAYHRADLVPGPIAVRPLCPQWLAAFDSAAPILFDQVCHWLDRMGTLSESDSPTIEAFVEAYFHHRKCLALLGAQYVTVRVVGYQKGPDGKKLKDANGNYIKQIVIARNPLEIQVRNWLDAMNRYAMQLGLNPVARAALLRTAPPATSQDSLEALFSVVSVAPDSEAM